MAEQEAVERHAAEAALADARERLDAQRQAVTARKITVGGCPREARRGARHRDAPRAERRGAARPGADGSRRSWSPTPTPSAQTAAQLMSHKAEVQRRPRPRPRRAGRARARSRRASRSSGAGCSTARAFSRSCALAATRCATGLMAHEMALREKQLAIEHLLGGVADKFRGAAPCRASWATTTCGRRPTRCRARASRSSCASSSAWGA